jgi:hypothetical protein
VAGHNNVCRFFLIHTTKGWCSSSCLSAQYQAISDHRIGKSVVLEEDYRSSKIMETTAVASHPRPTACYQVIFVFLIHITEGWCQSFMALDPMQG